jgi:hydrogenase nickel incorporation protein HypB
VSDTEFLAIEKGALAANDSRAADLRKRFDRSGTKVVHLVSSPGTGKTAFLEKTLSILAGRGVRAAALVGDLATDNDAARLARSGLPVRQIETGDICHLEADMVARHLSGWNLSEIDLLFIENVGNLVCPAGFDLGESLRVVLLSVTEGEDKPRKYPTMFSTADLVVLTKIDIADAVEFDRSEAMRAIEDVAPDAPVIETSAKTGAGLDAWISLLDSTPIGRRR